MSVILLLWCWQCGMAPDGQEYQSWLLGAARQLSISLIANAAGRSAPDRVPGQEGEVRKIGT